MCLYQGQTHIIYQVASKLPKIQIIKHVFIAVSVSDCTLHNQYQPTIIYGAK